MMTTFFPAMIDRLPDPVWRYSTGAENRWQDWGRLSFCISRMIMRVRPKMNEPGDSGLPAVHSLPFPGKEIAAPEVAAEQGYVGVISRKECALPLETEKPRGIQCC